jgi:ferric-dicitrate binding protein FerR (iron transport regulator)
MNDHQPAKRELREAWNCFLNDSYTIDDLSIIFDSLREDEKFQEFCEASNKVWDMSLIVSLLETEEQKEAYRRQAAQLLSEWKMRLMPVPLRKTRRLREIFYAAAAVLLLGALIPAARFLMKQNKVETRHATSVQYLEAATQRGEIKTFSLPDDTKVTLNAESRLTYPAEFTGERSVELQGEALFDVTPDSELSFTVTTNDMKITVLGTVFGVKAYHDDDFSLVSVASGKVEVGLRGETGKVGETGKTGRSSTILLEKNSQMKMDKTTGNFEKLTIDAENICRGLTVRCISTVRLSTKW